MRGGKCRRAVMNSSADRAQRSQVVLSGGHMTIELRSHVEFKSASRRDLIGSVSGDVVFRSAGTARLKRVNVNQISHEVIEEQMPSQTTMCFRLKLLFDRF